MRWKFLKTSSQEVILQETKLHSWPWNKAGIRSANSFHSQKIHEQFTVSPLYPQFLHIHGSTSMDSTNHRLHGNNNSYYWKKSRYKWTCAVQTHVVQGSAIIYQQKSYTTHTIILIYFPLHYSRFNYSSESCGFWK